MLPICIGEATKFSNYLTDKDKTYEVGIKFGVETDSGDITGNIVRKATVGSTLNALESQVEKLVGYHDQTPPMYSAVKIKGRPLYYWVRKGVFLARKERRIHINQVEIVELEPEEAKLNINCSKGTYIRGVVEELGRRLGCFATVKSLRRLKVGCNSLDTYSCNLNEGKDSILHKLRSCDSMLTDLPKISINIDDAKKVRNGQSIDYNAHLKNKRLVRIYINDELFIGLGALKGHRLFPKRLLATS